jgi:riboflavin kinase/FMN adenylyltransferase
MKIIYDINAWNEGVICATVGFFDGVHQGHRFLIENLVKIAAARGMPAAVITFPIHPRIVLRSDYQPKLLNSFEEKLHLLEKTGVDYVIVIDFTTNLAALPAREFISDILANKLNVKVLLTGYDHRFGYMRSDGFEQYVGYGKQYGIEVINASSFSDNGVVISSSSIRRLLEAGKVSEAAQMLGYHYNITGEVIEGAQIGRSIGFPTANIALSDSHKIIPRSGSYVVRVTVNNLNYSGMLYIGRSQETYSGNEATRIEVNIFDFEEVIYGKTITVEFLDFIRENIVFSNLDELQKQLLADRQYVLQNIKYQDSGRIL